MRKARRTYEPARGVVPIVWTAGFPFDAAERLHEGDVVVAEVWSPSLTWDADRIHITAEIVPLALGPDGNVLYGGSQLGARRVRRWAVLRPVSTTISLTLPDWPVPHD